MDASGTSLPLRQAYVQSARLTGRYSIDAMSARDREGTPRSSLPLAFCWWGAAPEAQKWGSDKQIFGED
jgi:hypothetical protein